MTDKKNITLRVYLIYFGFVLIMIAVIVKSAVIIFDGRNNILTGASENIQYRTKQITPRRGEILDAKLRPLLTSVSYYDIHIDTKTIKNKVWSNNINEFCKGLERVLGTKSSRDWYEELNTARKQEKRYHLIAKKVSNETRQKLRELPLFNLGPYKGGRIDNEETIIRKRPHDELLKRTLGNVRIRQKGTTTDTSFIGIEGAFDNYLTGQKGEIIQQKISGSWKSTGATTKEAIEGADVITTIDKNIQEVAHSELLKQLQNKGGRYGCAIVMEVETGFIKAIVNLNEGKDGGYYEAYNHAIGTKEVPGSTFKLASLMAALEDGKIKLTDTVNAVGRYEFYDRALNDDNTYGYGKITVKHAFEKSSNVISKIIYNAYRKKPNDFLSHLQKFGLTEPLGIDLAGERDPSFNKPGDGNWWGGSLAWMSIGYEFQQTPLQTLAFYNAVANNGKFMKPQYVSAIKQGNEIVKEFKPVVLREKICSQNTLNDLHACLEGVVENGTGKALKSAYFKLAGKTGTAKIANQNKGYGEPGEEKYIASFAGYFPAEKPVYSCIVVIAAPTKDIYGASVSGTVFATIANKVYSTSTEYQDAVNTGKSKALAPYSKNGNGYELNKVYDDLNIKTTGDRSAEWVKTTRQPKSVKYTKQNIKKNQVPNVKGMGLKDAIVLLEQTGMKVRSKGYGTVSTQSLAPGTPVVVGGIINIELK